MLSSILLVCTFCGCAQSGQATQNKGSNAFNIPVSPGVALPVTAEGKDYWHVGNPTRHTTKKVGVWLLGRSKEELFISVARDDPWTKEVDSAKRIQKSVPDAMLEEISSNSSTVIIWGFKFSSPPQDKPLFFYVKQSNSAAYGHVLLPEPAEPKMKELRRFLTSLRIEQ